MFTCHDHGVGRVKLLKKHEVGQETWVNRVESSDASQLKQRHQRLFLVSEPWFATLFQTGRVFYAYNRLLSSYVHPSALQIQRPLIPHFLPHNLSAPTYPVLSSPILIILCCAVSSCPEAYSRREPLILCPLVLSFSCSLVILIVSLPLPLLRIPPFHT